MRSSLAPSRRSTPLTISFEPTPATPGPTLGLTLSGGGFRATFAAVGALRYVADAGLLGSVRCVSSVSGGSIANGLLARH
jgi:NTE family protein